MKKKINNPIALDSYTGRAKGYSSLYQPSNIYARKWFGNVAVLVFCFIDFWCLQSIWNTVSKPENWLFIYSVAVGCALALDLPLAIAGYSLKEYNQGLKSKNENMIILILSIAVFGIAFIFSFIFRVSTKDMSYEVQSATNVNALGTAIATAVTSMPETDSADHTVLVASLFNAVIPLLTSISSFLLSYYAYSPLDEKIKKYKLRDIELDSNIIELQTAVAQADTAEIHCTSLLMAEDDLYMEFIGRIRAEGEALRQLARLAIAEKLNDAELISAVTQSAKESISKNTEVIAPENRLSGFLKESLSENLNLSDRETDGENPEFGYDLYDKILKQTV